MNLYEYIQSIEKRLEHKIENECKNIISTNLPIKHNHPPMTGIIPNCRYCQLYGNILEHGEVPIENTDLKNKLLCFTSNN